MKIRSQLSLFVCCALGLVAIPASAALQDGLISYWPLDATDGVTTPDITPNTNHLNLGNMTGANFVTGIRSNAASFDGTSQYLTYPYVAGTDNGLPVYNARYYTIAMWVKGTGTNQQTRAVFAEASSIGGQPCLFRLSTDTAGANRTNVLTALIRNNNNNALVGNTIDLGKSTGTNMPFNGNWHHIAWVDSNGVARLYVDGQLDPRVFNNTRLPEPTGVNSSFTMDTLALGAVVQLGSPVANSYFNGMIDDVAVWERTLSQAEINEVRTNGIPTPITASAPSFIYQPVGDTNLLVGESFALQGLALGTHPRTGYQWVKDGTPLVDDFVTIIGSTSNFLSLPILDTTNSGDYSVIVSNDYGSVTSSIAAVLVSTVSPQAANLTNGQIAYWPMDTVQGITTPDVVRGQDMFLYLLQATNVVSGKWGNAMYFDTNGMLSRFHAVGDALPAHQYRDFTISCWINAPALSGRRFYTECHTAIANPTFSLASGEAVGPFRGPFASARAFIRNDNNNNNADAGATSAAVFYDPAVTNSTWHHVVYRQRWVGGAVPVVQGNWYVDGVKDDPAIIGNQAVSPRLPLGAQVSSIGGQWRAGGTDPLSGSGRGFPFAGLIDDFAIWNRALTDEEIVMLSTNVVPAAPAVLPPLAINSFKGEFAEVINGGTMVLRWNVAGLSGAGLALSIDQGIGNVLNKTTNGIGAISITNITTTTTYTLTATRGASNVTAQTTVTVVNGVASGWNILDDFQTYSAGTLANPYWGNLVGGASIENVSGNRMLNAAPGGGGLGQVATLSLGQYNINQGQARTLFARIYVTDDTTNTTMLNLVGITDKTLKDANEVAGDIGPVTRLNDDIAGDLAVGAIDNVGSPLTLLPRKLEQFQVYNIWIDVTNAPNTTTNTGDKFSIWIQRQGEADRLLIASNYTTDRDLVADFIGPTLTFLDKVVVANGNASGTVYVDDIYLSQSGYLSTIPVGLSAPTLPSVSAPVMAVDGSIPGQITVSWGDGGALISSPSLAGPWNIVPDSFGYSPIILTTNQQEFFRIRR